MARGSRRQAPLLWNDTIVGSVVNKRLPVIEVGAFYVAALFHIAVVQAVGLTAFSCRIFGSLDPGTFPAPGAAAEAMVSTASVLAAGTSILRQPIILTADAGTPQAARIFPPFLVLEYTATILTRLQLEIRALFEAGDRVAGVERQDETPDLTTL